MSQAVLPHDERERLRTLESLQVLDTPADPVLDGLVRSAALALRCPVSLVSLVDHDRQWFKARVGLDVLETPRDQAFCAHTILGDEILEVPDAQLDPRFADNPLVVGEPRIRFYAAVPLAVQGHKLGTLCVIDYQPRRLDTSQRALLQDLAAVAAHWLRGRQQEQQLRQLSLAVEQSFDSVVVTDLTARIEYVNTAAVQSSGYARDELIGRNSRLLLAASSPAGNYREMWQALTAGRPWKGLLLNRRKDGSVYHERATISPVRQADGRITHYLAVKEDLTEKRRLGDELESQRLHLEEQVELRTAELVAAKAVAEESNEAKGAFLATMSHEIRTPMNGVVGIVDVLRQSSLTPYQTDLADTIRESAYALLSVIDDILDFSKIEAGRLLLEREPVELAQLIDAVCDSLQPAAFSRGVGLQLFVDPGLPDWIVGDELRLRQILNNLVSNAIKFSAGLGRSGQVALRAQADENGDLRLQVMDNGIGLSPSMHDQIFQPFVQAEGSTARRYGGTGLGLTLCRRLAEIMGGRIEVRSVLGQGATFTVTLPMQATEPVRLAPSALPALSGLTCHLLCPDEQQRADRRAYLEAAGAQVQAWHQDTELWPALTTATAPTSVVIVDAEVDASVLQSLRDLRATSPVAVVRVGHGQRRKPRLLEPGWASLDADGLRRGALLHAVALATGRASPEPIEAAGGLDIGVQAPPTVDEAAAQGRLVLVAEDNDINQRVIRRQLALLGLAAEVADGGLDALERWRNGRAQQRYGVLLTDLHMPGMDGYELTAAVRREEGNGQRLPIVALTANSLRDESDRCRAAGMDDFLGKPVQLAHLGATLARWLPDAAPDNRPPVAPDRLVVADEAFGEQLHPVLDGSVLVGLVGDDPDMLADIRRTYLAALRTTLPDMQAAVAAGDWAAVAALGHRLKSSSRAIGALALGECCDRIERAGRALDGPAVLRLHPRFEAGLALVVARLTDPELAAAEASPSHAVSLAPAEAGVMLVDDEPFELQLLQRQLALLGVAPVHACRAGSHALDALKDKDTSAMLLLVDLNMPGMDGVEFMRQLAAQRFTGSLALVSGADVRVLETAAKLAEAYQLNVLSHLHKPVQTPLLRTLIERWRAFIPAQVRGQTKAYTPGEISDAISQGALVLHYQPKVALDTGALTGVEALVRWQHASDGLVYPDSFIAVAEAHGLIDDLTRAVLGQALVQARRWRDQGLNLRMAVNVSMDNLVRLDFPDLVLDEVARHGVPPTDLVLEVTESRLMRDARVPMDILTRLRLKRIGLSIDDFGTGHSSLAQLRDIPFDELKIDRGFVHGSREHATQRAIFAASLEMAHQLGMRAVAEGVEDRADWDFARGAGCDVAQGYFIGRPMPADELPAWSRQWAQRFRHELSD